VKSDPAAATSTTPTDPGKATPAKPN